MKPNPRYIVVTLTNKRYKVWDLWALKTVLNPTTKKRAEQHAQKLNAA